MHVLLPPSEGKAPGGAGRPLDLPGLSWPALQPLRTQVLEALQEASSSPQASGILGLGPTQQGLLETNRTLTTSPTLRAGERYTGVLYDALGYPELTGGPREWAEAHVWVCSGLWGIVGLADMIPEYKLSMKTRLPGCDPLAQLWRQEIPRILGGFEGPVLDLRSGEYQQAGVIPELIRARVLASSEIAGVRRVQVISHHNKASKGRLVRALAHAGAETLQDVLRAAETCGLEASLTGSTLELVEVH